MSLLAPLFTLGLLAVSLPIVLHLIRRVPRGHLAFSSLMFLSPSPPRLTRRSRLDHLFLLLLRILVIALLACAFARPFLRFATDLSLSGVEGRQVAILVDTSASMRRGDLWQQAVNQVESTVSELEPADDVGLFVFDERLRSVVPFDEKRLQVRTGKAELVRRRLAELGPTWSGTDLGTALVSVAESMQVARDREESLGPQQIVLVSDFQRGALLNALQASSWPEQVLVSLRTVTPAQPGNASLRVLSDESGALNLEEARVRVVNSADSAAEQFRVGWAGDLQGRDTDWVAVYVPPGESRVVRVPRQATDEDSDRVLLEGDASDFDNAFFVAPPVKEEWKVVYVGADQADDPEGLHYYLKHALVEMPQGNVEILARRGDEPLSRSGEATPHLIVVSEPIAVEQQDWLKAYLDDGGTLLIVPASREAAVALVSFTGNAELSPDEPSARDDYVMLVDVDFSHPVFAALNQPRYSDFTKIHFWRHFPFRLQEDASLSILARFDNGDPALWEQSHGAGRVIVLASGWRPQDSQLALSSKFVPLMAAVLERAGGGELELPNYHVGDAVSLPSEERAAMATLTKPDGTQIPLPPEMERFHDADQPGVYALSRVDRGRTFAVNLAARESDTGPLDLERLEQAGLPLGEQLAPSQELERQRQLRDVELEGRQKLWKWLIALALAVVMVETAWAARRGRRPAEEASEGPAS